MRQRICFVGFLYVPVRVMPMLFTNSCTGIIVMPTIRFVQSHFNFHNGSPVEYDNSLSQV